jgi:hypothetical protein
MPTDSKTAQENSTFLRAEPGNYFDGTQLSRGIAAKAV